MKKKLLTLTLLCLLTVTGCLARQPEKMRFAFMTDIHLNKENDNDRYNGLLQALEELKRHKVDFLILGGDVVDVSGMGKTNGKEDADALYTIYKNTFDQSGIEYYPTIGNHDRYFDSENGYVNGDEVFNSYFGRSYNTFEKKGVRFFTLNSVQSTEKGHLSVGDDQLEWLRTELSAIPASTPIIVSTHVPVYSIYYPVVEGIYSSHDIISNYKELLQCFEGHNLRLVLQGHQHLYEEIFSQKVQYITGGAVCAGWWVGPFHGTKEGFLIVDVDKKDKITWEYIDYGWTAR